MKIEVSFTELDEVCRKMGIEELVRDDYTPTWRTIDIQLGEEGVEVSTLGDIEVASDGTLSYEGRKIIVYIRDQKIQDFDISNPENLPRFHITFCKTLSEMRSIGRYHRYVLSTREDGKFPVNTMRSGKVTEPNKLAKLLVCQNCLNKLRWDDFSFALLSSEVRKKMARDFSLKEFFNRYNRQPLPPPVPAGTDISTPVNEYSPQWEKISRRYRENVGWKCEEVKCRIYLGDTETRKFLHTHHVNGDKSDNRLPNLLALCVDCHNKQPTHSLPEKDLSEFREWKRSTGQSDGRGVFLQSAPTD